MSEKTDIAWTDSTVGFWSGCTKVSPGCAYCYAEKRDRRHLYEKVSHWGKGAPRLKHVGAVKSLLALNRKAWICGDCGRAAKSFAHPGIISNDPLVWCDCSGVVGKHRGHLRRVFLNQQSDWLDPEVPIEWLAEMLDTIRQCPDIAHILCTKRPELWERRLDSAIPLLRGPTIWAAEWLHGTPPPNVWILTSVEDQKRADERIPELLKIPAAVRGLSCEPLLEGVNLDYYTRCQGCGYTPLDKQTLGDHRLCRNPTPTIDWVIAGGESGSEARPCNIAWLRSLRDQCKAAGVPFFMKQVGSDPRSDQSNIIPPCDINNPTLDAAAIGAWEYHRFNACIHLTHPSGADPAEWPADLKVREFPSR